MQCQLSHASWYAATSVGTQVSTWTHIVVGVWRRDEVSWQVVVKVETERWKIVGMKWYGPDQRIDRDRILVIHRSRRSRWMGYRPSSNPIPWPHQVRQQ